jgi:hypothetical protein
MTTQGRPVAIASVGEAEQTIANLGRIMDALIGTIEDETKLVRSGKLSDANVLEAAKSELAGQYFALSERLKASRPFLARSLPAALEDLRTRHRAFDALLQINLTVLATAHAVSEGIVRGVSDEINRAQVPQTYGASGRASLSVPKNRQPMAINRAL